MTSAPDAPVSRAGALPLIGGALAFDLCNTSSGRGTGRPVEHLGSSPDVLAWARHANVLTAAQAESIGRRVAGDGAFGDRLLRAVLRFRSVLVEIGEAIATGGHPPAGALAALARMHADCLGKACLVVHGEAYVWAWDAADAPVEAVLGPIALSALALVTRADLARVKQCHGDSCGWLFLDTTKNGSRRWCEMEVCGNRAKQRRLQQRRTAKLPT